MNDSKTYASLSQVRDAVRDQKIVSFELGEETWTIEPHELAQAKRTGAFVLRGRVVEGPFKETWLEFRYSEIRGLVVERESFERLRPPIFIKSHRNPKTVARMRRRAELRAGKPEDTLSRA